MRINKKYQLQHVVSYDPQKPGVANIKYTGTQLFATDGRIAIIAEAQPSENAPSCLISPETWARAIKGAHKWSEFLEIDLAQDGSISTIGDLTIKNPTEESAGQYPDILAIWERVESLSEEGFTEISLDVTLLAKLAKGMGTEKVTLRMRREFDPIQVSAINNDKVKGLMAPLRRDGR